MNTFKGRLFHVFVLASLLAALTAAGARAQGTIIYVDQDATGANNGTSWANAYTGLQPALAAAGSGAEIWVAEGTYKPPMIDSTRGDTFQLKNNVAVYGGFAGGETALDQRDVTLNLTTLSGDIGTGGNTSDNSYHVVTGSGTDSSAVLDGFTVTGGNANGTYPNNRGGGMYNDGGSPTLTNVTFSGNTAGGGGGMYNYAGNPTLTNIAFNGNTAAYDGGGMYNFSSSPTLTNVTFSGNIADYGGGLYNFLSSPTLTNVTFSGNSANFIGGGIYNYLNSSPTIRNTILWGIIPPTGEQVYNISSSPTINDSVVQGGCPTGSTCSNIITADPLFGTLGNYGGSTKTIPLLIGSSAIDAGNNGTCAVTDQRGMTRPKDGDGNGSAICDIGAYEVQPPTDITLSNSSIDENRPAGTLVGNLSTTDPDLGDTFSYSFCGGANDASFQISGSALQSAAVFDYETKNSYSICIRSTDSGALSTTKTFAISIHNLVDTVSFTDVPASYWAYTYIERLYAAGITSGCAAGLYCPDNNVTRAEMSVFLERGIHGASFSPPNVTPTFSDTAGHWAEDWIEALKSDGITSGCGPGLYCPDAFTTRAEMAVFLLRSEHGASYIPPAATGGMFTDVPIIYWAAEWIEQLASEGITSGCGPNLYCPDATVTRAQMAVFLVRTFNLP